MDTFGIETLLIIFMSVAFLGGIFVHGFGVETKGKTKK